jgi:replication initiation and membrane attachment protein DnaB
MGNEAKLDDAYLKMKRLDRALEEAFEKEKQVKIETMSLMKKYATHVTLFRFGILAPVVQQRLLSDLKFQKMYFRRVDACHFHRNENRVCSLVFRIDKLIPPTVSHRSCPASLSRMQMFCLSGYVAKCSR